MTETTNQGHSPSWAAETESAKWIFEISVFCRLTKYEFEEMFHRAGFDHNCTVLVTASCQGGIR